MTRKYIMHFFFKRGDYSDVMHRYVTASSADECEEIMKRFYESLVKATPEQHIVVIAIDGSGFSYVKGELTFYSCTWSRGAKCERF